MITFGIISLSVFVLAKHFKFAWISNHFLIKVNLHEFVFSLRNVINFHELLISDIWLIVLMEATIFILLQPELSIIVIASQMLALTYMDGSSAYAINSLFLKAEHLTHNALQQFVCAIKELIHYYRAKSNIIVRNAIRPVGVLGSEGPNFLFALRTFPCLWIPKSEALEALISTLVEFHGILIDFFFIR